jgi:hypothetical protein
MMRRLLACCLWWACMQAAQAAPTALGDEELAAVRGGDGVSFALRLELNRVNPGAPPGDSRLWIAQVVDGRTTYTVLKNVSGMIQMFALNIAARSAPDGTNYIAFTLPSYVRFTEVGFDSLSVQADPRAPVTDSLGRFTLNGVLSMQGQLRMWPSSSH